MSLARDAADVAVAVNRVSIPEQLDLPTGVSAWHTLTDARRSLTMLIEDLEHAIGDAMPDKRLTAAGITVERSMKKARTEWDKDALLSAVLDSRLVDPDTGEVTEESPVDRVLHVWNLGAPRLTALRARGIDGDEFCHVENLRRWTLRAYS